MGSVREARLIFKSNMNNSLKRKVFDSCVLPVLTYGADMLTLARASENKLWVTQRAMESSMFGITLRDKMTNQWIRQQTKVVDVMEDIASLKWNWTHCENGRWTLDQNHHELETTHKTAYGQTTREMDKHNQKNGRHKLATSGKESSEMEGDRGGLHLAVGWKRRRRRRKNFPILYYVSSI